MTRTWIGSQIGVDTKLNELGAEAHDGFFRIEGPKIEAFQKLNDPVDKNYPYVQIVPGTKVFIDGKPVELLDIIDAFQIDPKVQIMAGESTFKPKLIKEFINKWNASEQ